MFHDSAAARDRDLERDLDAALDGTDTLRLGFGQVLGRPCSTAAKLARLFQLRGWDGSPTRCPDCDAGLISEQPRGRHRTTTTGTHRRPRTQPP